METEHAQNTNNGSAQQLSKIKKTKIEALLAVLPEMFRTDPSKAYTLIRFVSDDPSHKNKIRGIPPADRKTDLGKRCLEAFLMCAEKFTKPGVAVRYGGNPESIAADLNRVIDWAKQVGGTLSAKAAQLADEAQCALKLHEKKLRQKLDTKVIAWIKKGRPSPEKHDLSKKELLELEEALACFPKMLKENRLAAMNFMYARLCSMPRKIIEQDIGGLCILAFGEAINALASVIEIKNLKISPEALAEAADDAEKWALQYGDKWLLSEERSAHIISDIKSIKHSAQIVLSAHKKSMKFKFEKKPIEKEPREEPQFFTKNKRREIEALLASIPEILKTNPGKAWYIMLFVPTAPYFYDKQQGVPLGERKTILGKRCLEIFLECSERLTPPGRAIKYGIDPHKVMNCLESVMEWSKQEGPVMAVKAKKLLRQAEESVKLDGLRKRRKLDPKVEEWLQKGRPNPKKKDMSKKELQQLEIALSEAQKALKTNPLKAMNVMFKTLCYMPQKVMKRKIGGACILAFGEATEALTADEALEKYGITPNLVVLAAEYGDYCAYIYGDRWYLSETRNVHLGSELRRNLQSSYSFLRVHEIRQYEKNRENGYG